MGLEHLDCDRQITELQETIEYIKEEYINLLMEYTNLIGKNSHAKKKELFEYWNDKIKDIE